MTFTIYQTKTTPFAELRNGYLQIRGKSVPFNEPDVYTTIIDRMTVYMRKPEDKTVVDFTLSAINASSKRSIIDTFNHFEKMSNEGVELKINWFYDEDDEDVFELGEICKSAFELDISLKEAS